MCFIKRLLAFAVSVAIIAVALSALAGASAKSMADTNSFVDWNAYTGLNEPYAGTVQAQERKTNVIPKVEAKEVIEANEAPSPVPVPSTPEVNSTKPTFPVYVPDCGTPEENAEKIFAELTTTWELNEAAAYGIMTNILVESAFSTTAIGPGGDFGIAQWCGSRYESFIYWCNAKEYNPYSIDTQILYLGLELTNAYYSSVYSKLTECENNTDGLYDAAYIFCKCFEIPQNTEAQSLYRADLAVQVYGGNFWAE